MQAPSRNLDQRLLPRGWVPHFDHTHNNWYYIGLEASSPRVSHIHPDDEGDGPRGKSARSTKFNIFSAFYLPLYAPTGRQASTFKSIPPHLSSSSDLANPIVELAFRHHRSARLPPYRPSAINTPPSGSTIAQKEAPMCTTTARLSSQLSGHSKLMTPPASEWVALADLATEPGIVIYNITVPKLSAIDSPSRFSTAVCTESTWCNYPISI
ncbi:hypothetical protein NLJ89_g392 [Agrocybe chaxingu]|uniref:Uncharacterized protein n=1 Tax=Agrocybe chaxingu TaxID=84603 RepID=A0A9W8N212_9AGAR|nr:hypothetical protein NLJ89_g392 [Agrocybe chaxingu]